MPFNERLAERVREALGPSPDVTERKMFGGLTFLLGGHMCCGIIGDALMARVGPNGYEDALARSHTRIMDFTGRPMRGMVYVDPPGIRTRPQVAAWVARCVAFAGALPPK